MAKAILLVYTNPPEGKDEEFNHWYDTIHVPDILGIEGYTSAQRYKLSGPGPKMITPTGSEAVAQYLAVYELDTDDTRSAMKRLNQTVGELAQRGRMLEGLQIVGAATYTALGGQQTAGS